MNYHKIVFKRLPWMLRWKGNSNPYDNIFSNSSNFTQGISGNITLTISDHMAQFLIIPEDKQTISENTNIYKRDHRNFDKEIQ